MFTNRSLFFLLTRGIKHDQDSWVFLQKRVEGLISQMEDRGARLRPRHLWGLWLRGLRAERGNGKGGDMS